MSTMPTFSWPFVLGLALALVWTTIPHISAQSVPIAVQEFAFARSGSRLLVSGGRTTLNGNQVGLTGQLFALDLSRSWDVSNAPWVQLAASNPAYWYSMVAAPDNSTVYTLQSGVNNSMIVSTYNAQANAWLPTTMSMPPTAESRQGVRPILDPTTWMVYLDATTYLDVFNPNNTGTTSVLNMPPNTFTSRLFSGGVYNRARHSLMYYGGLNYSLQFDLQATYVTEYTINTNTWSNLTTTGTPPPVRSDFCLAASEDGNTLVVYGGRSPNSPVTPPSNFTNTFFVLDVPTGKWTQGPNGDLRAYMACIIVGDQFIAWGGTDGISTLSTPPRIFDLTKMLWVTTYTAPSYYFTAPTSSSGVPPSSTPSTNPLPGTSGSKTSTSSNMGAILGGALGGLAVIGLAGAVFVYLKRKEKAQYSVPTDQQGSGSGTPRNGLLSGGGAGMDGRGMASASAGMSFFNEARNPQNIPVKPNPNSRGPQEQSGLGSMAPLMAAGVGYATGTTGYSPYNQSQHVQQQFQAYPQPPVQYTVLPKEMQAETAPMTQISQFSAASPFGGYVPKTAYSAPAGVGMPVTSAAFAQYQPTTTQGYVSPGAPTEDIYKAHVGSPSNMSTFSDSTAASTPYTGPPSFTSRPTGSPMPAVSGYVSATSYTHGNSNQTFNTSAANASPVASHASYNYNSNSSFSPSTAGHSSDVYAQSTTVGASPAISAAGHLPQGSFTENGLNTTAPVRVPESIPEDQYLAYVLAQQQHDQNLTSADTTTTTTVSSPLAAPSPPQNLPPRPNMQSRLSTTGTGSNGYVRPPLAPPQ